MRFAEDAFREIFPGKEMPVITVKYSGKFKLYNANVTRTPFSLNFKLSKAWRKIDDKIKIGLIQSLLAKIYKTKVNTMNIDLYNSFTKHIHVAIPKTKIEPMLKESFERVNEKYFNSQMEMPNLVWGHASKATLGTYNYHSDTISISSIFKQGPDIFIDSVMYHEILHKKLKFYSKNNKNYHHTSAFRSREKEFENQKIVEHELKNYLRSKHIKVKKPSLFGWWFR